MAIKQIFNTSAELDYPTVLPTLDLDFANSKTLDPRITFTRASGGSYYGADGLIKLAGVNEPRFDHNPTTGESLGLLVEEARTNLITYSQASTGWYATTMLDNTGIAPDGTNTAMLATDNAGFRYSLGAGTFTYSFFVKQGTSSTVILAWSGYGGIDWTFTFSTQSLVVAGVWSNASVVSYPNGWYRISATTSSRDNYYYHLYADSVSSTFYLWGCQGEAGAFPTSYIPTVASSRTRAADVASITGTNFSSWFNQSSGTFFIDLPLPLNSVGNNDVIFSANNGSATDNVLLQWVTNTPYWKAASVQVATSPAKPASSVSGKYALAWDSSSINAATDGNAATSASSSTVPTSSTTLNIFNSADLSRPVGGTIARLTYYPKRLTNQQLQVLTT